VEVQVVDLETDQDGRRIVLFTTEPITLQEANARLLAEGLRRVMRLDEVRHVKTIPVLGTGKTDYKILRAQLADEDNCANFRTARRATCGPSAGPRAFRVPGRVVAMSFGAWDCLTSS